MATSDCSTDCSFRLIVFCVSTNCVSSQRMWSRPPAVHLLLAPHSVEDLTLLIVEDHRGDSVRKTLSDCSCIRQHVSRSFPHMLVALIGCRVSCVTSVGKGQAIACVGTSRRAIFLGIQR